MANKRLNGEWQVAGEGKKGTPLRCTGKSAEAIDGKGVMRAPLGTKSAEPYENAEVSCGRSEVRRKLREWTGSLEVEWGGRRTIEVSLAQTALCSD